MLQQCHTDCCLQGLGTDDKTLVRVIVSRCEVDLMDIKAEFQSKYHKTLGSFIKVRLGQKAVYGWLISVLHILTTFSCCRETLVETIKES